jgi:hypothetical protein
VCELQSVCECPSNVDVASLKAEFCTNIKKQMVLRFAIRFFANNAKMNAMGSLFPRLLILLLIYPLLKKEWELL